MKLNRFQRFARLKTADRDEKSFKKFSFTERTKRRKNVKCLVFIQRRMRRNKKVYKTFGLIMVVVQSSVFISFICSLLSLLFACISHSFIHVSLHRLVSKGEKQTITVCVCDVDVHFHFKIIIIVDSSSMGKTFTHMRFIVFPVKKIDIFLENVVFSFSKSSSSSLL